MSASLIGYAGALLAAVGTGVALYFVIVDRANNFFYQSWMRYHDYLKRELRFLLSKKTPLDVVKLQALGMVSCVVGGFLLDVPVAGGALAFAGIFVPLYLFPKKKAERLEALESQLDGWLMMLANSLRATPALGEALESTVGLVQSPMADEIDLLVKQYKLGTPLDQAIRNSSERIGSPVVSSAMSTLMIARQTGGDLPLILERSAESLREMARLEGVVRTKTAEGKGQLFVVGGMPLIMVFILGSVDPHWMDPLTSGAFLGYIILAVACVFWLGGVIWARIILDVDI